MNYIFRGSLCGYLCGDCQEPLSGVIVRLYRIAEKQNPTLLAVADAAQTFHQRSDGELRERNNLLFAETTADAAGDFSFELGEKQRYGGEAFDIDFVCGTGFGKPRPPKNNQSFQFHITTVQPQWREKVGEAETRISYYGWKYCIASKWWCWILKLIDRWVICGTVTDCQTGKAIEGVKVLAFDVDLLQDDPLGFAYTNGSGHFRIVYTSADFSKTIFSWLNVEWPAGPDLYFRVESASGQLLLQEDRNTGHRRDRENAHNCFCVRLCIKDFIPPVDVPWFTHVGNYNITSDINASGFTINNRSAYGPAGTGFGFFNSVDLVGYATKRVPAAPTMPLFYRFLFSTDSTTWSAVTETQMAAARLKVGVRQIIWNGSTAFQDIVIDAGKAASVADSIPLYDGTPIPPDHVLRLDANGWVRVDQAGLDNGFYGPLLKVNTATIVAGGNATSAGDVAGNSPAAPKNGQLVHFAFETTDDPANPASPHLARQSVQAHLYINNWNEVSLLVLDELMMGLSGCNPITNHANVHFTADHELMAEWLLGVSSAGVPSGITINTPGTFGTVPRGNNLSLDFATSGAVTPAFEDWPTCAYRLQLNTRRMLTDGVRNDDGRTNELIFCHKKVE